MNRIEIPFILWMRWNNKKEIGVAEHKLQKGLNEIVVTAEHKGKRVHEGSRIMDFDDIIKHKREIVNFSDSGEPIYGHYIPMED